MFCCYLLSLNITSFGIYRDLKGRGYAIHLFHPGGGLEAHLGRDVIIHRLSVETNPEAVIAEIKKIQSKPNGAGVIFTSSDGEIEFVHKHRATLETCASLPFLSDETFVLASDKLAFCRQLEVLSIRTPKSCAVDVLESKLEMGGLTYPFVIKPIDSSEWKSARASKKLGGKKAFTVETPHDVQAAISLIREFSDRILFQELIDVDENGYYSFCAYSDNSGKVLWGFVTQKILQFPEKFGTAILCATTERGDIYEYGKSVVEALGICGVSETEIVVDRKTKQLCIIEVNARHWMQHRLSSRLGVNISLLDLFYRTGNQTMAEEIVRRGDRLKRILWIDERAYVMHLLKNLFRGDGTYWKSVVRSAREYAIVEAVRPMACAKIFRSIFGAV
jgi:predicted ATP-grasp superfamily ATP-dependent carboligase